jgi:hypothetical protein
MSIAKKKIILSEETPLRKEQFWRAQSQSQKESGLSRRAYCREHQLNYEHFNYWERKFHKQTIAPALLPVKIASLSKTDSQGVETLCTLAFKNGHELKIHDKGVLPLLLSLWGSSC